MKLLRLFCLLCLLSVSLLAFGAPGTVLAQEPTLISEDEEKIEEKIEMSLTYPKLEAIAGENFEFEVGFKYTGEEDREFEMQTTAPKGWDVYITPPYEKEKKIKSMTLKPSFSFGDKIRVVASAPFWPLPEPGDYNVILEVSSGELKGTTELKAIITARYTLLVRPAIERYNTTAKAGEDNFFSIKVGNLGTAPIDDIKFSSTKPDGWAIEFEPDKIDSLKAIDEQTIDVNIKPPPKTIAGDYQIKLRASGKQTSADEVTIRVTVESPTIWGWVGVAIIFGVVIGLAVIFWRFSRR